MGSSKRQSRQEPAAEEAARLAAPKGAGNRNAATVYDLRYFAMDMAGERRGFAATWVERKA